MYHHDAIKPVGTIGVSKDGRWHFACRTKCGYKSSTFENFQMHAQTFHTSRKPTSSGWQHNTEPIPKVKLSRVYGEQKPYGGSRATYAAQQYCNQSYNKKRNGKGKEVFTCGLCPLKFIDMVGLIEHRQETHVANRTGTNCPACNKFYATKLALWNHVKKFHSEAYRFECTMCPMAFEAQKELIHHQQMKHIAGKITGCLYCDAKFVTAYERNNHVKAVHSATKRKSSGWHQMDTDSDISSGFVGIPW